MATEPTALPLRDLVDVRLAAAIDLGGCAICVVRSRAEVASTVAVLDGERVMDIGFRASLERTASFCRRHMAALIVADRHGSGILSTSILYGTLVSRRVADLRDAIGSRGRTRRRRLDEAQVRFPCVICAEGTSAGEVATQRLAERSTDGAWAAVIGDIPFCLDDLVLLLAAAGDSTSFAPLAERQLGRLEDLAQRLDDYVHNSSPDRRHLLTDDQRRAADDAARALSGD